MELDELKHIWQNHTAILLKDDYRTEEDIGKMLRQRSRQALSKINRSIAIEVGILLLLALGACWQLMQVDASWHAFASILLGFVGLSLVFYAWKYRQLNRVGMETANLKEALTRTTQTMAGYMRLYSYAGMIVVPLLGACGVLYGVYVSANEEGTSISDFGLSNWIFIGSVVVIYAGLSILFTRWYVRKLYGVHYDELRNCLVELQESGLS